VRVHYDELGVDGSGDVVARGLRTESASGEWVLTAEVAYLSRSGAMRLEKPVMRLSEDVPGQRRQPREIVVRADRGWRKGKDEEGREDPEIRLEGNVLVESRAEGETIALRCSNLVWNDETGHAAIRGPVEIAAQLSNGRYTGSGEDAEADIRAHRVRILRSIHLVLSGGIELLPSEKAKAGNGKPEGASTHIVCRGPLEADGLERKISLAGPVDIARGGDKLRARQLALYLTGERENPIGEMEAIGDVRLTGAELSMSCDRLRRTAGDQFVLMGNPATLKRGKSVFEAGEIRLSPVTKKLSVRAPGNLSHQLPGEDADPQTVAVSWSHAMDYDPEAGQAFFHGDVRVTRAGRSINCDRFVLVLDPDSGDVKSMIAQNRVRARIGEGEARGDVITYEAAGDRLTLEGRPRARLTRKDSVVAAPKIHVLQAEGVIRCEGAGFLELAAAADGPRPGPGKGKGKKRITWSKGMSYADREGRASFAGEVRLEDAGLKLDAGDVEVRFTEEREIKTLACTGAGTLTVRAPAATGGRPVSERRIHWQKRMTYRAGERTAEFRGKVRLVDGGQVLEAEALDVAFTPEHRLQMLSCPGSGKLVAVVKDGDGAAGSRTVAWKGNMRFDRMGGTAVFRDDVTYSDPDYTLRADVVRTKVSEAGELRSFEGEGNVRFEAE